MLKYQLLGQNVSLFALHCYVQKLRLVSLYEKFRLAMYVKISTLRIKCFVICLSCARTEASFYDSMSSQESNRENRYRSFNFRGPSALKENKILSCS